MKRLLAFSFVLIVAFSGCRKSDSASTPIRQEGPLPQARASESSAKTPIAFKPPSGSLFSSEQVPLLEQINRENIKVASAAMPSIVRVTSSRPADPHLQLFGNKTPFSFHFGPGAPHNLMLNEPSYGSGVIISRDGYVVTNYHVIEDARDVGVQLHDKRSFPARIVAFDAPMDMAVLKIDASGLTALPWGDSDKVQVGEQVFAIGNPFNLEDSVTKGIVSATGRNLPESSATAPLYVDYIQTDAAINPGNSGGALINIHGELIGFNDAIASTSGGNMGVGFAIPSNLARYAVEGLLKEGKLVRGYLGVKLPETVDDQVIDQLHLGTEQGALLAGVQPGSPADQAHLRAGDFITEVDGHKVIGIPELRLVVSQLAVGKEVSLSFIRDGKKQSTTVKIAELTPEALASANPTTDAPPTADGAPVVADNVLSGLQVTDLDEKIRAKLGVDSAVTSGVVVSGVDDGSPADIKGLQPGDVIESASVGRASTQALASANAFAVLAKNLKPKESVVLLIHHGKTSSFIYLAPQK